MSISSLVPAVGAAAGIATGLLTTGAANGLRTGQSFLQSLQATWNSGDVDDAQAADTATDDAEAANDESAERLRKLQSEIAEFQRQLARRLAAMGVDLSTPVELKSDGQGGVLVDDPHPQRVAVERLFAQDRELTAEFAYLAAACGAEDVIRGSLDPGGSGEFRLRIDNSGGQVVFE